MRFNILQIKESRSMGWTRRSLLRDGLTASAAAVLYQSGGKAWAQAADAPTHPNPPRVTDNSVPRAAQTAINDLL
jgi:hypothetical protein